MRTYNSKDSVEYKSRGSFRCIYDSELILIPAVLAFVIACIIIRLRWENWGQGIAYAYAEIIGFLFLLLTFVLLRGRRVTYELTDKCLIIRDKRSSAEYFYYSEITDISWETLRLYGIPRGQRFTVKTSMKTVTYKVISVYTPVEKLPFYTLKQIIDKNVEKKGGAFTYTPPPFLPKENTDGRAVFSEKTQKTDGEHHHDEQMVAAREFRDLNIRSGHFRVPFRGEIPMFIVTTAATVFYTLIWIEMVLRTVMILGVWLPLGIGFLIWGTIMRTIWVGKEVSYSLDEEKMTITVGKEREYFYYTDITDVKFENPPGIRQNNGYVVTICAGCKEVRYTYLFGRRKNQNSTDTPFIYLMQNCGIAERGVIDN